MHNHIPCLRKAGFGAWWADGHPMNASCALEGHVQTNNRAELAAVLHALRNESRDVHIKTDSAYVLRGCLQHRWAWAAIGWDKVQNADLWKQVHDLLQRRVSSVVLSKVKGHATPKDVAAGRVSARDKHGNDAADCLASAGASSHAAPPLVVREVMHRRAVAKAVQTMMIAVLAARMHSLANNADDNISRASSDSGSCSSNHTSTSISESLTDSSASSSSSSSVQHDLPVHTGTNHPT